MIRLDRNNWIVSIVAVVAIFSMAYMSVDNTGVSFSRANVAGSAIDPNAATAPIAKIVSPVNNSTVKGVITLDIRGMDLDGNAIVKVEWYLNGVFQWSVNTHTLQSGWDTNTLPDKTHTIEARVYNSVGLMGSKTSTFIVDNIPAVCGNNIVEAGEQCDDGTYNGMCPRTCTSICTKQACSLPDFAFGQVTINPNYVTVGQPVEIIAQIYNRGLVSAPMTYAYTQQSNGISKLLPQNDCYSNIVLAPGQFCTSAYSLTWNTPGTKIWQIDIDADSQVIETDEFNGYGGAIYVQQNNNSVCGNGIVEAGEQCDNGINNGVCPAQCSASCTWNNCNMTSAPIISSYVDYIIPGQVTVMFTADKQIFATAEYSNLVTGQTYNSITTPTWTSGGIPLSENIPANTGFSYRIKGIDLQGNIGYSAPIYFSTASNSGDRVQITYGAWTTGVSEGVAHYDANLNRDIGAPIIADDGRVVLIINGERSILRVGEGTTVLGEYLRLNQIWHGTGSQDFDLSMVVFSVGNSVSDILRLSQTKLYTVNGNSYEITALLIGPNQVRFLVNGVASPIMREGETSTLQGIPLEVYTILTNGCPNSVCGNTPTDTTPPVLSNVQATSSLQQGMYGIVPTITITAQTNEPTTLDVFYGTTPNLYSGSATSMLTTSHNITLGTGSGVILPSTTYYYMLLARDAAGNNVTTPIKNVTTVANQQDITPPVITPINRYNLSAGTTQTQMAVLTNEYATCRWATVPTMGYQFMNQFQSTGALNHTTTVTGLQGGYNYRYVKCQDQAGNTNPTDTAVEIHVTDLTPPMANITTPLTNQQFPTGTTSITLSVTTNEFATCRWSTSNQAYNSMPSTNTMSGSLTTSHSATLTGLQNGQNYTRHVRCLDLSGNAMTNSVTTFFSVRNPTDTTPPTFSNVYAYGTSDTGTGINLLSSEPAYVSIQYGTTTALGAETSQVYTTSQASLPLNNLQPGTLHYYRVKGKDLANNVGYSNIQSFTTNQTVCVDTMWTPSNSGLCGSVTQTSNCGNTRTVQGTTTCTATQTCTNNQCVTASCTTPAVGAFRACYYDNKDFTSLKINRVDNTINNNWGSNSPATSIAKDTFSATWLGQFSLTPGRTYTFSATSDDGIRVFVNGVRIINDYTDHSARTRTGTYTVPAGQTTNVVKVEYYENTGSASAKVWWT